MTSGAARKPPLHSPDPRRKLPQGQRERAVGIQHGIAVIFFPTLTGYKQRSVYFCLSLKTMSKLRDVHKATPVVWDLPWWLRQ